MFEIVFNVFELHNSGNCILFYSSAQYTYVVYLHVIWLQCIIIALLLNTVIALNVFVISLVHSSW